MLYTVSFTTQKLIKKFDTKGNLVSETRLDTPVTITALPHATALSYSGCDNFKIEPYQMETDRRVRSHAGIGNGTRKVKYDEHAELAREKPAGSRGKSAAAGLTAKQRAAVTGNLGAALDA